MENDLRRWMRLIQDAHTPLHEAKFILHEFQLPTAKVGFYDDPTRGVGDDGWTIDEIVADMQENDMQLRKPIEVGRSRHENDNGNVVAIDGNHRLAACKKIGRRFILCVNSDSYDAQPLTLDDILALGGHTLR